MQPERPVARVDEKFVQLRVSVIDGVLDDKDAARRDRDACVVAAATPPPLALE